MCGIAGALGDGTQRSMIDTQLRLLDHRGPDSWGVFQKPGAIIGQTRLAIIDLVTGDPPVTDEGGNVGVALNGEIYNFGPLRRELACRGHRMATTGDTEVIAHLAEELEPVELARALEGMFAFAVWDDTRRRLILGRDRFGKKPLYYWRQGGRLVFASEIKAILAHPFVSRDLAHDAIPAYLTFGYVPTPRTFFEGIESLPPGHVLVADSSGVRTTSYWEPAIPLPGQLASLDLSIEEAARAVRRKLSTAVDRRMMADVPVGAFLSGGIDSSAIVALMASRTSTAVRTFTIGFEDDEGYDERDYARQVSQLFGTDHCEFVVKPKAVDLVERLVWHYDQPFGDSSAVPTYLLSQLTRDHVSVALCGDGGDEVFAGYERFSAALLLDRYRLVPLSLRRHLARAGRAVPRRAFGGRGDSLRRFLGQSALSVPDAYLEWVSTIAPEYRHALLPNGSTWAERDYQRIWEASCGADLLDRLLDLNLRTYLLDDLLPKVDRTSMAHGLEVRAPFLDRELVEFALRLPRRCRVGLWSRKRVLKAAVGDLLPAGILHRRKRGFRVPLDRWFRLELRSYVEATLGARDARVRAYLQPEVLDQLWSEHQRGLADHGHALWSLLTLEVFLRHEKW